MNTIEDAGRLINKIEASICRAAGVNYGKPHVPVLGKFNGKPRYSCLYCGCWLGEVEDVH